MEKKYWTGRQKASAAMAGKAKSSRARLVHLELAGRYSARAGQTPFLLETMVSTEGEQSVLEGPETDDGSDAVYFSQLEAGAHYLAATSEHPDARAEHLRMAAVYRERARGSEG